jgi:ferric iron reductase protein FhuF
VASLLFLAVAARVVAPAVAAAVLAGVVPEITLETVVGAELGNGRYVLSLTAFAALNDRPDDSLSTLADLLAEHIVRGQLSRLVSTFAEREALPPRLLWGNVASVVASAARLLAIGDPRRTAAAGHFGELVLRHAPLAGCGEYEAGADGRHADEVHNRVYRRRSCCLYNQLPNAGSCADCPIDAANARVGSGGDPPLP